jgi:hypothetical protein
VLTLVGDLHGRRDDWMPKRAISAVSSTIHPD